MQEALEVRLRIAQVSGAPRAYRPPQRLPHRAPARLVLVKGLHVAPAEVPASLSSKRGSRRRDNNTARGCRVIKMPLKRTEKQNELLLGSMAAFGPLVWIGHALLVWLKLA